MFPPDVSPLASAAGSAAQGDFERALVEATEREQQRLAQSLHDTVCQSMSAVHLLARLIGRKVEARCPELGNEMNELGTLLQQVAGELHDLTHWLREADFESGGLVSALRRLAETISEKVPCKLECPDVINLRDRFAALQLYYIARDVLGAALQGTGVTRISLSLLARPDELDLSIRWDGHDPVDGGIFQVELLHQRATAAGATLSIKSLSPKGAAVECRLPLNQG
jgi:signal transduction histidine kinase